MSPPSPFLSLKTLIAPAALAGALAVLAACLAPKGQAETFESPRLVDVPAGPFISGSGPEEREVAYQLDEEAYGHSRTRQGKWYSREDPFGPQETGAYRITETPITNALYAQFIAETGHPAPEVDEATWKSYRLIHPYERTRRHAWRDGTPPPGRENHPVVMVSHGDAQAFAAWFSDKTGQTWRLPSGLEWEKAARGDDGRFFPWGNDWDPTRLNSHDEGPFDTLPVGSFPSGASPYGLLDGAGQVYEWTSTPMGNGRYQVRGGSWDDSGCGVCRPAARHGRPEDIKHILVGFRLVTEE